MAKTSYRYNEETKRVEQIPEGDGWIRCIGRPTLDDELLAAHELGERLQRMWLADQMIPRSMLFPEEGEDDGSA